MEESARCKVFIFFTSFTQLERQGRDNDVIKLIAQLRRTLSVTSLIYFVVFRFPHLLLQVEKSPRTFVEFILNSSGLNLFDSLSFIKLLRKYTARCFDDFSVFSKVLPGDYGRYKFQEDRGVLKLFILT